MRWVFEKWAKQEGIECYRLYDADLPEYNVAVDRYADWVVIQEYAPPKTIDAQKARQRMLDVIAATIAVLGIAPNKLVLKTRERQKGKNQYQKMGEKGDFIEVGEYNARLWVNLTDYLDTGLFLDHRIARRMLGQMSKGKDFLNLFAYTGTATCYAADGGVEETVTVDLSNTYLDWAERNMRQNGFVGPQHHFVRDDVLAWIRDQRQTRNRWDLIFVDPPTFSNSSKMGRRTWDVQRDHVELLAGVSRLLAQGGHAIFSCNLRGFRPETRKLARAGVVLEDITAQTIPEDFARNQKVHHCYIVRRLPIEDAMAEVGFSAEEIAERTEELRNPEARKPRAAVPAHAQTGNGKSNFAGKPSPAGKSKKKKFYASKPKGK